ncbi:MAG: beta-ketoacyl-ACP synthase II [Chloroflexota bacterium]
MTTRVVVTGMGAVTPIGLDVASTWDSMVRGKSGIGPITSFDASNLDTRIAAEVKGFDAATYIPPKEARRMDRFVHFGVVAAMQAMQSAGIEPDTSPAHSMGVIAGSGIGGITTLGQQFEVLFNRGPDRISPFLVPMMIADMLAGQISISLRLRGPNFGVVSACATSGHAIGEGFATIRRGDCEALVVGGTEAAIVPIGLAAFGASRAISTRNDEPERASRPFDAERDGFVMAEGGGMLVIESLERATARGATIYAEILGYGATADAYHITAPPESGEGAARCMKLALDRAGLEPSQVDYINAHGTSTPLNDKAETQAIKTVFEDHAYSVPISSTKSVTGHMLGAGGVVEAIACIKAITEGVIPPTVNLEHPDPDCDLDYVPHVARQQQVNVALSNSLGFGGHNSTLVFGAFRG